MKTINFNQIIRRTVNTIKESPTHLLLGTSLSVAALTGAAVTSKRVKS